MLTYSVHRSKHGVSLFIPISLTCASRLLVLLGTLTALFSITDPGALPLFEEIPPSTSGITWVHENAMSEKRYLPETMGPGAAFFDYNTVFRGGFTLKVLAGVVELEFTDPVGGPRLSIGWGTPTSS